jgi:hypothetical protein
VASVTLRRFARPEGSPGRGGSSLLTTRRRSLITSTIQPVRPWRCRLKPLLKSANHCGRSSAIEACVEICVKSWQALKDSQGFWRVSPDETPR